MKRYFTLIVREAKNTPWSVHFGDYDRDTVEQEQADIVDAGDYAKHRTMIIQTTDQQSAIEARLAKLNGAPK